MYKVLEKKPTEVKLEIEVEKEKLKKVTDMVLADLSETVKIDGFRPGKAPLFMVEKEIGKDRFWAEVVDKAVPESFYEAVISEKIITVSQPQIRITQFIPGEKLIFEAVVAILPGIKDLKYKDLKIKEQKVEVTENDKKEAFEGLLQRYSEEKEVERAAKKGDRVEIDFAGTMKGLPFDGGESKNHPVMLGSGMLVPGFEEKVEGHKKGDEFEFDLTFPKDYHAANLAGGKVRFKVKLNKVSEIVTPKADDAWAKKVGNFESLAKLKEELEKQIKFEKELAAKRQTEEEMLAKIIETNKIEAPEILAGEEVHRMVHEAEHNLSHSGLTMEKFLEMSRKTLGDLEKEMKPEAEKRVKIGVVLGEIARAENVQIGEKEVEAEIEKIISVAGPETSKEDLKAAYEEPGRRKELENSIIIRKTLDKLWTLNVQS